MRNFIFALCASSLAFWFATCANETARPDIVIENVWSRPVKIADNQAGDAFGSNGVVYLNVKNRGGMADRLLSAKSNICQVAEIHRTVVANNRMSMQKIENGVDIPAGDTVEFKPGDFHIMLIGLQQSLNPGDGFTIELQFEKSGFKKIESQVRVQ